MRELFLDKCRSLDLKGTILISEEGVNINLSGEESSVLSDFKKFLSEDNRFSDITFKESVAKTPLFKRLKVKIKKEIITMGVSDVKPAEKRAPSISPREFKKWLDENKEITVLDTRNEYEIEQGTFEKAVNLHLEDFSQFPTRLEYISKEKPIVMFCTGGIRCEKAALLLEKNGFQDVYQLEGGILNYFSEVGGVHYRGQCFVFDERVAVDSHLQPIMNK